MSVKSYQSPRVSRATVWQRTGSQRVVTSVYHLVHNFVIDTTMLYARRVRDAGTGVIIRAMQRISNIMTRNETPPRAGGGLGFSGKICQKIYQFGVGLGLGDLQEVLGFGHRGARQLHIHVLIDGLGHDVGVSQNGFNDFRFHAGGEQQGSGRVAGLVSDVQ